jgi:predicted ATPase
LFGDAKGKEGILMFDEPETSLHPHALAALAEAMQEAGDSWGRQVILATHSPALLSQFSPNQIFQSGYSKSSAVFQRLDSIQSIRDLLVDYSVGSLYMAEAVGSQSALQTS